MKNENGPVRIVAIEGRRISDEQRFSSLPNNWPETLNLYEQKKIKKIVWLFQNPYEAITVH